MNIILYAVPVFFLLIATELLLEKVKSTQYYRLNDTINSLTAGVMSQMVGLIKLLIPVNIYLLFYQSVSLFSLPDSPWTWVLAFVIYDFCYYWNHRLGHEMNILWAAHVVHHSSEEYNLSTALRQSSSSFFSWIFYLPLAIMGFEPELVLAVGALNLVYQFWVHTRHVPKLGWFEWIFVTPSNHRVHHAQNQIYIDRNYGGVFILWDRLFNTFQPELDSEKPIYGIRKALKSWNPLWANVHVYSQLIKDCWHAQNFSDKILIWFKPTGWRPADVEQAYPLSKTNLAQFKKFDIPLSLSNKLYSTLQYFIILVLGLMTIMNVSNLSDLQQVLLVVGILLSSLSTGFILENRWFSTWTEWAKHLMSLSLLYMYALPIWLEYILFTCSLLSIVMLLVKGKTMMELKVPEKTK
ncbi:sterol desaturase family protein [Paraglaciecola sp.]|uniref:sterol desaturase family protein n=1 Tax=Paraglaciecola sp. TaxID=1920173 RepID=UPI003EF266CC